MHCFFRQVFPQEKWDTETKRTGCAQCADERMERQIRQLNQHVLHLLNGLIRFKEQILQEVTSCCLYTANYPLLADHVLREANHYLRILGNEGE